MDNRLAALAAGEEIDLNPVYTTPAPIPRTQMVIHADAGRIFHHDAIKTGNLF